MATRANDAWALPHETLIFIRPFDNLDVQGTVFHCFDSWIFCALRVLGRVDELFDDDPCCHEMNKSQKGLAQFLIPRGNTSELFEVVEEPFDLLA